MTIRYLYIEDAMPRGDVMRVMGALYDHARQLTDVGFHRRKPPSLCE
ncbi:MAG: hypothetical protein QM784_29375 [Polyangiaceae bacterium]